MLSRFTKAFTPNIPHVNYGALPDHVRNEILDAMEATSKTDIR